MAGLNDVPELVVHTECVRRTSESSESGKINLIDAPLFSSDAKIPPPISENVTATNVTLSQVQTADLTRNDSYSKFGPMETINLNVCDQSHVGNPLQSVQNDAFSPSTEELISTSEQPNEMQAVAVCSAETATQDDLHSVPSNTQLMTPANACITKNEETNGSVIVPNVQVTEQKSEQFQNSRMSETISEPSHLSKVFVEENANSDGKAFFDRLAKGDSLPSKLSGLTTVNPLSNTINQIGITQSQESDAPDSQVDDEVYDAWLYPEATDHILRTLSTAEPGTYFPEIDKLTIPHIIIEEEMDDPIKALLHDINSPVIQERKVLSANDVTQDAVGVTKLIGSECYHAAINLTTRLLKKHGYSPDDEKFIAHTPEMLQIWFIRIALFVKLRKFSYAEVESEAFGDLSKPDLFYEFYSKLYNCRKGSMVPFSFRLLLAELPQYQGNHQVALNNLYNVLHIIQKMIHNLQNGFGEDGSSVKLNEQRIKSSVELWRRRECRVLYSVMNCVLSQKDYLMAVSVARVLMEKDKNHIVQLYSALGRIYLQLGDMRRSQECFDSVCLLSVNSQIKDIEVEKIINKALLSISHNENEEALKLYKQALVLQPTNPMLINNMAVCLLYMGQLRESLTLLEQAIQKNPSSCLHEGILFNICTLYELESSYGTAKKHAMLNLVAKYAGDSFPISCLKIPPISKG